MKPLSRLTVAAAALAGAALFAAGPANAGVHIGIGVNVPGFYYGTGYYPPGPCDSYDYYYEGDCGYDVYNGGIYLDGGWVYGPHYYRWSDGEPWFWYRGRWHRWDGWRGVNFNWSHEEGWGWHHGRWDRDWGRAHYEWRGDRGDHRGDWRDHGDWRDRDHRGDWHDDRGRDHHDDRDRHDDRDHGDHDHDH